MRWRTHNEVTLRLWHNHFCWRPVKVGHTWVWLESVKRKGTLHTVVTCGPTVNTWITWEYMLPEIWGR